MSYLILIMIALACFVWWASSQADQTTKAARIANDLKACGGLLWRAVKTAFERGPSAPPKDMRSDRGEVTVLLVALLAVGAAGFFVAPSVKQRFAKKAPIAEVEKAQAEAAALRARVEAAEAELARAAAADEARKQEALGQGHEMIVGAQEALAGSQPTPEVKLARSLLERGDEALVVALGKLPADKRAQIVSIVHGALSKVEAERDAALQALKQKDVELEVIARERKALASKIPVLEESLQSAAQRASAAERVADVKQAELASHVREREAVAAQANSLSSRFDSLIFWGCVVGGLYVVANWALPSLAAEARFKDNRAIQDLNSFVKSITSAHQ